MFKSQKGLGLVELVITIAIITVALLAFAQAAVTFLRAAIISNDPQIGANLAQEGVEAVRALRDESWSSKIAPLTAGNSYYPVKNAGAWVLNTSDPGPIDGKFTRFVVFNSVMRAGNSNIVESGGTNDPNTRKVAVTVSWTDEKGVLRDYVLTTYITNFLSN